jgi:microcystin-dependent protein
MRLAKHFLLSVLLWLVPLYASATVNTSSNSALVLGTGSQTVFSFSFIGVAPTYISVVYTSASGTQTTLTQGSGTTQYQVMLNAPVQGAIWGQGGTITYNPSGTPIPVGSSLTIYRTLPLTQAVSLANQASYGQYSKSAEQMGDVLAMQVQQLNGTIGRAIIANIANSAAPLPLPPAAQAANQGLCFDGTGNNVIACTVPSSGIISSAMQPVVSAASLALGRTALGLGTAAQENIGAGLQDNGSGSLRANQTIVADASNTSVTSVFHATQRAASGPFTYTFPRANTLWNGFGFWVFPRNGTITLAINASDSFQGLSSGVSTSILTSSAAYVTTDAATSGTWYILYARQQQTLVRYAGELIPMGGTTCPSGTTASSGGTLSRTTNADLFAYYGTTWGAGDGSSTFGIPDTRGYFLRGFDAGSGVDSGRVFGVAQQDQLQDHTHLIGFQQGASSPGTSEVPKNYPSTGSYQTSSPNSGNHGTETRPKNQTITYCIQLQNVYAP